MVRECFSAHGYEPIEAPLVQTRSARERGGEIQDSPFQLFDEIGISGGRRGISLRLDPEQLASFIGATFADIVR